MRANPPGFARARLRTSNALALFPVDPFWFDLTCICIYAHMHLMEIVSVYKCLCDRQRLRILNLLSDGPLCVCHLMEILDTDQVKISKQLRYMRALGMVEGERRAQWMVYRLAEPDHPLLVENLKCLQDLGSEDLCFSEDLEKRSRILDRLRGDGAACAPAIVQTTGGPDA